MIDNNNCFHCGLPIPSGLTLTARINEQNQPVCCNGCKGVAETIAGTGLGNYYKFRTQAAERPSDGLSFQFQAFDTPAIQQSFVTNDSSGTATAHFIVKNIHCAACIWLIENTLSSLAEVHSVNVQLENNQALIKWSPDQLKLSKIMEHLSAIGYELLPYSPDTADAVRKAESRQAIFRLGVAGIGMMQVMMIAIGLYAGALQGIELEYRTLLRWVSLLIATPVVFYSARPFFQAAWRDLKTRHLTMDFPVALAIGAAYSASTWVTLTDGEEVYFDSVTMFTFFLLLGRFLETRARSQSEQAIAHLRATLPQLVQRLTDNGSELIPRSLAEVNDQLLIKKGDTIPTDGTVINGQTRVDESALTGEFMPINKQVNDSVTGGTINQANPFTMKVTAVGSDTRFSTILRLVAEASSKKPKIAIISNRVASYFVATVLIIATAVALFWINADSEQAFAITLSVLVITCPCALSLATPAALTAATSHFRNLGIIVLNSQVFETLPNIQHIIFDKTGTLTKGNLSIIESQNLSSSHTLQQCTDLASALESHSEHPIATAFGTSQLLPSQLNMITGKGIEGEIDGQRLRIGSWSFCSEWFDKALSEPTNPKPSLTPVFLSCPKHPLALFLLDDTLRSQAKQVIEQLTSDGYTVHLLSGDHPQRVKHLANELSIDHHLGSATPEDKLAYLTELQHSGGKTLMIGDGINDAPVLSKADVSITVSNASDLAKLNADVVLLSPNLSLIVSCLKQAKRTRTIIIENISWAILYNLSALPLAACGMVAPYAAALGMSSSSLLVVINSLRLSKAQKSR